MWGYDMPDKDGTGPRKNSHMHKVTGGGKKSGFKQGSCEWFDMTLRHAAHKETLDRGYASEWNDDHVLDPTDLNDYYLFLLSDYANKFDDTLIFIYDMQELKKLLDEAPEDKKESWNNFKEYLKKNSSALYEKVRNLGKLIDFIISREK